MRSKRYKIILIIAALIFFDNAIGQVALPRLISNGMILQRDKILNLWGRAFANEEVSVLFNGAVLKTNADQAGKWNISLPSQKAGGPYELVFKGSNGSEIKISNVLFGDVWICSGQSNMELSMERVKGKYADEVASAHYSQIRQFTVPDKYSFKHPEEDVASGNWKEATGKDILGFSAVAYFFAKEIFTKYKVPVGLINAAVGGSPAEAWLSEDALKSFPDQYKEAKKFKNDNLIKEIEKHDQTVSSDWYALVNSEDEGLKNNWKAPGFDDSDWKEMKVPGDWPGSQTGNINGVVWFRKEIAIPASMAGQPAKLEMGRIVDADSIFINNVFIGNTTYQYPPRRYQVPAGLLKEGSNHIVIKVISNSGQGGFVLDKPYYLQVNKERISLEGSWKYKPGAIVKPLPGQTFVRWKPLGLYNAMIAPLQNYPIKGVLWYQGESNTSNPSQYMQLMKTLINDWRTQWKQGNFPFLFVQLANFMAPKNFPSESNWAATRQAQLNTLSVSNTAMAVTIDLGDWNDIHPENKKDVGIRLALLAKKLAYGDNKIICSGPLYHSIKTESNKIIISFTNTGSGLMSKNGEKLKYFSIAGADNKYTWADAVIKNNKVIVWSDDIAQPVSVRYAWADNPEGANLYNKEGLPASPFCANVVK